MNINTIVVNSNQQVKRQVCFLINNLSNYRVNGVYDYLCEVKHLNKDSLLILSLNTEDYDTDFLSLHEIVNRHHGLTVIVLATCASKDIILKAFSSKCAAIVDKIHFQLFAEHILESIYTLKGFYVSPLFVKFLIEEGTFNTSCSTVNLSKKQNDIVYYISLGYSNIEIANTMNISINTVKKHISLIYSKLKISSKFELNDLLHKGSIIINPRVFEPNNCNIKFLNVTEKEQEILSLLNMKKSVKEIAYELSITQISTRYYIRKLKQKKLWTN